MTNTSIMDANYEISYSADGWCDMISTRQTIQGRLMSRDGLQFLLVRRL
jgi:hypothetical protein